MLNQEDRATVRSFADNPALFTAVKRIIEAQFTLDTINPQMTNEQMGQVVRARISGLAKIEDAFKEIAQCKTVATTADRINRAK